MSEFHFRKRSMEITVEGKQYTFRPYGPEEIRRLNQKLQTAIKNKAPTEERLEVYVEIIDAALGKGAAGTIMAERGDKDVLQDADDLVVYLMACQAECMPTRRPTPVWTGSSAPVGK